MTILTAATLTVADVAATTERYRQWMDYALADDGVVSDELAASWGAPASAGRRQALLRPASGADSFLRFVQGDPVESYRPIRSFGWAAVEICVQDVHATAARMAQSPFEIIGPPSEIPGLPIIHPMQVRGPDQETVYLTQILTDDPAQGLGKAQSFIDRLFILVLAARDLEGTASWFENALGFTNSPILSIRYSMIAKAFGLPITDLHDIVTARVDGSNGSELFLEFDRYPPGATERPSHPGQLPPGVAICTLTHPDFACLQLDWLNPPVIREGPLYRGRRVGVVRTPEGALVELIEG